MCACVSVFFMCACVCVRVAGGVWSLVSVRLFARGHVSGWAAGMWNNSAPLNSSGAERDLPHRRRVEIDLRAQRLLWDKQLMGLDSG